MQVDFYHLERSPLEKVLPSICEKVLGAGGKLLIVADQEQLAGLDRQLWDYAPDSFLPHGTADRPAAEHQPILLSSATEATNGAANIALADGRWRDEALAFERVFYFFDAAHRDEARDCWRKLKDRPELERRYWKQDDRGKWLQGP